MKNPIVCTNHSFSPSITSARTNRFEDWMCSSCNEYMEDQRVMNFLEQWYDRVMGVLSKIHLPYMKLPNMEPETATNNDN